MKETPWEMADRIEADSRTQPDTDQKEYGLMMASVIRKSAAGEYRKDHDKGEAT